MGDLRVKRHLSSNEEGMFFEVKITGGKLAEIGAGRFTALMLLNQAILVCKEKGISFIELLNEARAIENENDLVLKGGEA